MKKFVFLAMFVFLSISMIAQTGQIDSKIRAKKNLVTDSIFTYRDTIIPVTDVAYIEYSTDGVVWTKDPTNAQYMRISVDVKNTWNQIDMDAFNVYWEIVGDSLKPVGAYLLVGDSIYGGVVNSDLYKLSGDTLSLDNLYTGGNSVNGYVLTYNGDNAYWTALPSFAGNAHGRNVGVDGYGVYHDTIGSELQFRNVASGDDFIDVSLVDSTIYFSWDGTSRTIFAGVGLSGGGVLSSDVTINLYIPGLTELTSLSMIDKNSDFVPIYDNSAAQHKKIKPRYFHPDVYIDGIQNATAPNYLNFTGLDNVTILGGGDGSVQIQVPYPSESWCNTVTQTLSGTTDTLDVADGIHGVLDITGATTIRIEPTSTCNTGNITIICDASGYTIEFVSDYTMYVSPYMEAVSKVINYNHCIRRSS